MSTIELDAMNNIYKDFEKHFGLTRCEWQNVLYRLTADNLYKLTSVIADLKEDGLSISKDKLHLEIAHGQSVFQMLMSEKIDKNRILFAVDRWQYRAQKQTRGLFSAQEVANWFLATAKDDDIKLDQIKIDMLVYASNGVYLACNGKPLINEPIIAGQYGPFIKSLYDKYKYNGMDDLAKKQTENQWTFNIINDCDSSINELLRNIWKITKEASAIKLLNWSHNKGGPWDLIWSKNKGKNAIIPNVLLECYFNRFLPKGD